MLNDKEYMYMIILSVTYFIHSTKHQFSRSIYRTSFSTGFGKHKDNYVNERYANYLNSKNKITAL